MGQNQSQNNSGGMSRNSSVASDTGSVLSALGGRKGGREHKRHGVVTLRMNNIAPNRQHDVITHKITPKGCILYGASQFNPAVIQNGEVSFCI